MIRGPHRRPVEAGSSPDFGEMRRALRALVARERDTELPAVQPMYDD
jgi:hypothetical protein